jgi:hypothetical protein
MEINCIFYSKVCEDGQKKYYICEVSSASIINPSTKIKAFVGRHQIGGFGSYSNKCVGKIQFYEAKVEYFPHGLNLIFSRLKSLEISNCGLKEISRNDLVGLEDLESLYLNDNQLTYLPKDLFRDMENMKIVQFCRNKLESIDSDMLKPLERNEAIDVNFRSNTKIDAFYRPGASGSVASMAELKRIIDEQFNKPAKPVASSQENFRNDEEFVEFKENFLSQLWQKGSFSDFVIITDGPEEFHVHKTVLGLRSSAFKEMFENNSDQNELKIESLEANSVEEFLRYIYTGEIAEKLNTKEVFALAARFKVETLKRKCEKKILDELDQSNAFKVFNLGQRYSSDEMKIKACEEIKKMFPHIDLPDNMMDQPEEIIS